jgi:hypothetical protein
LCTTPLHKKYVGIKTTPQVTKGEGAISNKLNLVRLDAIIWPHNSFSCQTLLV